MTTNTFDLASYAENAYLEYTMAVVKGRALPQVQDGQKPVHRRILQIMSSMGLANNAKPVKCARIVGDALGKLHPHGDTSVYDALVRMAQPFSLRYPLINGQGNFGSRDGDSAAAMRYTEASLTPIASLLLEGLHKNTVDFKPNYDGAQEEACLLNARLPFTLLNGSQGIAVGMANEIPSHNLEEVGLACIALYENPALTVADLLSYVKGPDFPDGAQVVSSFQELLKVYETGRGAIRVRARWTKEDLARGQWQVVINELPYQVSPKKIMEEIEVLSNPQPAVKNGKKQPLTPQQIQLKTAISELIDTARDESNKDCPIRLVIEPKTSKIEIDKLMAFLLANTSLEQNFSANFTVLGLDGNPKQKNLLEILTEWNEFRLSALKREFEFDKVQLEKRKHILEGRLTVFASLEKVVAIIKEAENPKEELVSKIGLSLVQAEDILEMKLRQLNKLEGFKIEKEIKEINEELTRINKILSKKENLVKEAISILRQDISKYKDDRRTLIKEEVKENRVKLTVAGGPVTVCLTKNLWLKAKQSIDLNEESWTLKPGDSLLELIATSSDKPLIVLTSKGRIYNVDVQAFLGSKEFVPLTSLISLQPNEKPLFAFSFDSLDQDYLIASKKGQGFTCKAKNLLTKLKAGKSFFDLAPEDEPLKPIGFDTQQKWLFLRSSGKKILVFDKDELKERPNGGSGIILMDLGEGTLEKVVFLAEDKFEHKSQTKKGEKLLTIEADAFKKFVAKRARKGVNEPN